MNNSSLHKRLLTAIFVLMLFVCSAIVWISIQAGTDAVNQLTQRIMSNMIGRIGSDNEQHLNEAMITLETVAPNSALPFDTDFNHLEQRLWAASALFMQTNSYVYFAGTDSRFIGVNRQDAAHITVHLRNSGEPLRHDYVALGPGDRSHMINSGEYDARTRPWYIKAMQNDHAIWADVYTNYSRPEPTITVAKAVYQPDHSLAGVVATDIPLAKLSENLRSLSISANSVAFIIDEHGDMIATSSTESPFTEINHVTGRISAAAMPNSLIKEAFLRVIKNYPDEINTSNNPSHSYTLDKEKFDVAFAPLGNKFGLKWITVVVVPRADFMHGITHSVVQSFVIAVLFIILALIVGLVFIEHILGDIRQLTSAAQKIGNGEPLPRLRIHRKDEIGHLINTFIEMENKLRFDRLTQIYNREFLIAQIEFLERHARTHQQENINFTLLFLDLDKFKNINDSYGHSAGDQLLIVIASRLKAAVRETDTVARFGGDEFVVLLNGTSNAADIQMTVDKIHALVEQPIALADNIVSVHVSVGWATFPTDAQDYLSLVKIADARMFSTKQHQHNVHLRLV